MTTTILASLALVAFLARLGLMVRLHTMGSPYDPMEHAVSDYAVGPTRRTASVASWLSAVGTVLLAGALAPVLTGWSRHTEIVALLVAYAVLAVVIVAFPTDLEGERRTRTGVIHLLVAIVSFTLGYEIVADGTPGLGRVEGWAGVAPLLGALRWVVTAGLVGVVVTLALSPLRRWFGLAERVFLGGLLLWFVLVAGALAVHH